MERKFTIGLDSDFELDNLNQDFDIINADLDQLISLYDKGEIDVICSSKDTRDVYIKTAKNFGYVNDFVHEHNKAFIVCKYKKADGNEVIIGDIGANPQMDFNNFQCLLRLIIVHYDLNPADIFFGLINIGEEPYKGDKVRKELYKYYHEQYPANFIGNIEGDGLFTTIADIVLVDGFTGNVLLKALEAAGLFDYKSIGGARLIGINANVYIGHGKSDLDTVTNMCLTAYNELKD